jgi:hypothetical protein
MSATARPVRVSTVAELFSESEIAHIMVYQRMIIVNDVNFLDRNANTRDNAAKVVAALASLFQSERTLPVKVTKENLVWDVTSHGLNYCQYTWTNKVEFIQFPSADTFIQDNKTHCYLLVKDKVIRVVADRVSFNAVCGGLLPGSNRLTFVRSPCRLLFVIYLIIKQHKRTYPRDLHALNRTCNSKTKSCTSSFHKMVAHGTMYEHFGMTSTYLRGILRWSEKCIKLGFLDTNVERMVTYFRRNVPTKPPQRGEGLELKPLPKHYNSTNKSDPYYTLTYIDIFVEPERLSSVLNMSLLSLV